MAKSKAEINRANYLKNKQKIKAKYAEKNGTMYYSFDNVTIDSQLYNNLVEAMNKKPEIFFDEKDKNKVLTEKLKNDLILAAYYIYDKCRKNKYHFTRVYMKAIRRRANMLPEKYIRKLIYHISDVKMSVIKKDNGTVFFLVNEKNEVKKIFNKEQQSMQQKGVVVRDFKFTHFDFYKKNETMVNGVKMVYNTMKDWNLLTYQELKQVAYSVVDGTYQTIGRKKVKVNHYEGIEQKFDGFHIRLTKNEQAVVNRYKTLLIEEKALIDRIEKNKYYREKINMEDLKELCEVLNTLQKRDFTFSHGRLYYPMWTKLKKQWRGVLTLNGQHLIELFDIPTCHSTKSLILYSKSEYRNEKELVELYDLIMNKDVYCQIAKMCGEKNIDGEIRDYYKEVFNTWLFLCKASRVGLRGKLKQVDKLMQKQYPTFHQFITEQEDITVVDEDGKEVQKNVLSVKCQWLENKMLVNGLFSQVIHLNTITLHDSIWITEDQYCEALERDMYNKWSEMVKKEIFNKGV